MKIRRRAFFLGAGAATASAAVAPKQALSWLVQKASTNTWTSAALGTAPPLGSIYAFVRNVTTGQNLYAKDADTQTHEFENWAASTTKMATAVLTARELGYGTVTTSTETTVQSGEDYLSMAGAYDGLTIGDIISVGELLHLLMIPGGNDTAYVLGRVIGDAIQTRTGSGVGGRPRFVTEMNALAAELGMTGTVYTSPDGYEVPGNRTTARDLARLTYQAFEDSATQALTTPSLRDMSIIIDYTATVTGPNARDIITTNFMNFTKPITDVGYLAGKSGGGAAGYSAGTLWQAPNGNHLVIVTIAIDTVGNRSLDIRGLLYEAMLDFPSLAGTPEASDPQFANVVFLSGADPGFTDESSYARTITNSGATRVTTRPIGTHSYSTDGSTNHIDAADAAELSMGAGDFAIELWFRGNATSPTGGVGTFISKYDAAGNQREYMIHWAGEVTGVVSDLGTIGYEMSNYSGESETVFFNGALRHILLRRSGNEFALYLNGIKGVVTQSWPDSLFNGTSKLMIGAQQSGAGIITPLPGRFDEIRITKGNSRQTAVKFLPIPRVSPRV